MVGDLVIELLFKCRTWELFLSFQLCVSVSGDLSVGVCNKEQLYILVDTEAGIFLIYSLF
jgi:hypothetical protein